LCSGRNYGFGTSFDFKTMKSFKGKVTKNIFGNQSLNFKITNMPSHMVATSKVPHPPTHTELGPSAAAREAV